MVAPRFSPLSFGAWAAGGVGWGAVEDRESVDAMRRAVELGITVLDTAPIYGFGHSEEVVGRALKGIRDRVLLVTKCGLVWDDERRVRIDNRPATLFAEVDRSLRRLEVEQIDLYLVHWPDPGTPLEETMNALEEIRASGKVRWIGVSNFDAAQLEQASRLARLDAVQLGYNLLNREVEAEVLPTCSGLGLPVMAYSPLAQGLLAGRFTRQTRLAPDDVRNSNPLFAAERLPGVLDAVDRLREVARRRGRSLIELALGWVLRQAPVATAVCGARKPSHLEGLAAILRRPLVEEEIQEIEQAVCAPVG